jgi:colanic acid/amylovoran biosynthesis glycosyltransferase
MKTVLFLTTAYPYLPGEQFIEDEIGYWSAQTAAKVVLVPLTASGVPRSAPAGFDIDLTLARTSTFVRQLTSLLAAVVSTLFWREAAFIFETKGLKLGCYARALRAVGNVIRISKALTKIQATRGNIDVAYCYWNEVQCYATVLLKRRGLVKKVISRAHGVDLYEERRAHQYMPLKRQFIGGMDTILAIGNQGKYYLKSKYNALNNQVIVSRLGVPVPKNLSSCSESSSLNIVSVSFCIKIKRIDKIIDAIAAAASQLKPIKNITWTHIGGGPLLSQLMLRAEERLTPLGIQWNFLGTKKNIEVKQYFQRHQVDFFVNTSESEGVPVSIMEAMSYGVPTIAADVGGIAELVSFESGFLLSQLPSVAEIASAMVTMASRCKQVQTRVLARQKIIDDYSAERNYKSLVQLITN